MFLICNGILAFLVKSLTSSISSSSSPSQSNLSSTAEEIRPSVDVVGGHDQDRVTVEAIDGSSGNVVYIAQEEQEREERAVEDEDEEHAEEKEEDDDDDEGLRVDLAGEDDHGEIEEVRSGILVKQEEEDVETKLAEEGRDDLGCNDDDLNRKIEEFIRKMKEEIRIEARQQLIAV